MPIEVVYRHSFTDHYSCYGLGTWNGSVQVNVFSVDTQKTAAAVFCVLAVKSILGTHTTLFQVTISHLSISVMLLTTRRLN